MLAAIFRPLLKAGVLYIVASVASGKTSFKHQARHFAKGAGLIAGSFLTFFLTFVGLAAALFFHLADFKELVQPALITTLLVFLIATFLGYRGWQQFKQ